MDKYKFFEFFILFILVPVSLVFPYDFKIKVGTVLSAFIYLLYILFFKTVVSFKVKRDLKWCSFWKNTLAKFMVIALTTTIYVWYVNPASLFCVPLANPWLFIAILLVYSLLSVWPQEVVYRTFFFDRYENFFGDKWFLIFVNALVFSLAHLFFKNMLVIVLTFIGGVLFAYTYYTRRSTIVVSLEHAIYGNWLFTVGMGDMLAFPGMESCAG